MSGPAVHDTGAAVWLPWCSDCRRTRFGMTCVECGRRLELAEFLAPPDDAALARAARVEHNGVAIGTDCVRGVMEALGLSKDLGTR